MEAIDAILSRRSIRRYTAEPITADQIRDLLRAAFSAPSAGNQQPWHFVVIDDRATLDAVPSFHAHAKMILEAPVAVLVCAEPGLETHKGYWVQDCAAATENLLLAAHAIGLGAVWLGVHTRPDRETGLRRLLSLPDGIEPFALIAIGHPAESKPASGRWIEERIHRNGW
jgi:nitroreductase